MEIVPSNGTAEFCKSLLETLVDTVAPALERADILIGIPDGDREASNRDLVGTTTKRFHTLLRVAA